MTYDIFTIKAQDAIVKAQSIAAGNEQQEVDTPHLLKGIFETDEDLSKFLFQKLGYISASAPVCKSCMRHRRTI